MIILFFLLLISVQACNFDKGQFYYVKLIDKDSEYSTCAAAGLNVLQKSTCTDTITANGRFSSPFTIYQPKGWFNFRVPDFDAGLGNAGFDFSNEVLPGVGIEMYEPQWTREAAPHRTRFTWTYDKTTPVYTPKDYCKRYNYSTGVKDRCITQGFRRVGWFYTADRRPYGCSFHNSYVYDFYSQNEVNSAHTTLWRDNGGNCGRNKLKNIFPEGYKLYSDESWMKPDGYGGEEFAQGILDKELELQDDDVCICNRPGQSEPKCISDCPLEDHPDPEMYYARRFPPIKHIDDDGNEYLEPIAAFDDCRMSLCISGGWHHEGRYVETFYMDGTHKEYVYEPPVCKRYGCTDPTAMNYNAWANTDDGTCIPEKVGCMMEIYDNYDQEATVHDVSLCGNIICSLIGEWAFNNQCCV
mgnify:CR=1 FL=1